MKLKYTKTELICNNICACNAVSMLAVAPSCNPWTSYTSRHSYQKQLRRSNSIIMAKAERDSHGREIATSSLPRCPSHSLAIPKVLHIFFALHYAFILNSYIEPFDGHFRVLLSQVLNIMDQSQSGDDLDASLTFPS